MEEQDFDHAETTLLDLIDEYIPYSSNSFPGDGDHNDDDGDGRNYLPEVDARDVEKRSMAPRPPPREQARNFYGGSGDEGVVVGRSYGEERPILPRRSREDEADGGRTSMPDILSRGERDEQESGREEEAVVGEESRDMEEEVAALNGDVDETRNAREEEVEMQYISGPTHDFVDEPRTGEEGEMEEEEAVEEGKGAAAAAADDDDEADFLNKYINDVRTRKKKSNDSHEFDRIMERKDSSRDSF